MRDMIMLLFASFQQTAIRLFWCRYRILIEIYNAVLYIYCEFVIWCNKWLTDKNSAPQYFEPTVAVYEVKGVYTPYKPWGQMRQEKIGRGFGEISWIL